MFQRESANKTAVDVEQRPFVAREIAIQLLKTNRGHFLMQTYAM